MSDALELAMLVAVIVLAIAAGLLLGLLVRRRARNAAAARRTAIAGARLASAGARPLSSRPMPGLSAPPPVPESALRRARSNPPVSGSGSSAGGTASSPGVAIAVGASERVCPSCKTVYQDMVYCQKDARRLVPLEELTTSGRSGGLACPRCGRSFEHGLRRCPHDGGELVPLAMYQASRRRRDSAPTGVLAKVCPVCRRKFDLSSRFCGRDGHELVVVN